MLPDAAKLAIMWREDPQDTPVLRAINKRWRMGMTSSIAAIHVAKKQLGLDDDTYRAKLTNITGKASVKDMTEAERQKVLTVFRNEALRRAPTARRTDGRQKLTGKFAKKLQALWIAGYNLGVVENRDDAALLAFVKRQTGLDHTRFLHHAEDARAAIEALKAWLHREAGVSYGNLNDRTGLPRMGEDRLGAVEALEPRR